MTENEARVATKAHLASVYSTYRPWLPAVSRWEDERERWNAVAFAVLLEGGGLAATATRRVVSGLAALDLLNMRRLAAAHATGDTGPRDSVSAALASAGVEPDRARQVALALSEAAAAIVASFGTLQKLLRQSAEDLLARLMEHVPLGSMGDVARGRVFTTWLQDATGAPLSMTWADKHVVAYCAERNIDTTALVELADHVDLNLPVLDHLLRFHMSAPHAPSED